jgi:glycerate 2-kinase
MFDLPLDAQHYARRHHRLPSIAARLGRADQRDQHLRKHFSAVKGGRLAMAAPEAAKVSLLLPDVPLRSLDALSSGPTSPDHSTVADVRNLLEKYDLKAQAAAFGERLL